MDFVIRASIVVGLIGVAMAMMGRKDRTTLGNWLFGLGCALGSLGAAVAVVIAGIRSMS